MKRGCVVLFVFMILTLLCGTAMAEVKAGNVVTLGRYEQDDDPDNGREPIEWQVLAVEGDRMLVISKYGLDSRWYNYPKENVTWAECDLRSWLNEEFYEKCFDAEEQGRILEVLNTTSGDPDNGTDGGADTLDKVFVLSIEEAESYFASDEERKCEATAYAKGHSAFVSSSGGMSEWWLRNPGKENTHSATVGTGGRIQGRGNSVNNISTVFRPAFWMSLPEEENGTETDDIDSPIILSGFLDLSALSQRDEEAHVSQILSIAEAEEMGLNIPVPADGEILYLGEARSEQAERFLAVFTMAPDTQELRNLNLLVYKANFDSGSVKTNDLTVSVKSSAPYPVIDGTVDGGSFRFNDFTFTEWGASADFSFTLNLPQPAGFSFTFDDAEMIFEKQTAPAAATETVPENAPSEDPVNPAGSSTNIGAGDHIFLGHYEQDDRLSNGPEPIEWRVLSVEDGQALVISEYGLDGKRFHDRSAGAMWADSSLRAWLNGEFLDAIFSGEERTPVIEGEDILFLLSTDEAKALFSSDEDRICKMTLFAAGHGSSSWWWLSTQNYSEGQAACVRDDGSVSSTGNTTLAKQLIRPAFRLDLNEYAKLQKERPAEAELPAEERTLPEPAIEIPENIRVGNRIAFGRYEQDNDPANGPEPVEWRILAVENERALLISEYGLDTLSFHNRSKEERNITWHESEIREWLNGEFLDALFSENQKQQVMAEDDQIFLLSVAEAQDLFASDADRVCYPTEYAIARGAFVHEETGGSVWWWLRTQGHLNDTDAACVEETGEVSDSGNGMIFDEVVRPAFWLDLEAYVNAPEEEPEPLIVIPSDPEIGDTFTFGRYEQDDDPENGAEPIEWQVLAVEGDRALVISKYILDAVPFHAEGGAVTWEDSSLRAWLNDVFLNTAFSAKEQGYIQETDVQLSKNPVYETDGGNDTRDKLFLPDITEAETYFSLDDDRQAFATEHAQADGAFADGAAGASWWWLRNTGCDETAAAYVGVVGWIMERGNQAENPYVGVRPAFWIDLNGPEAGSGSFDAGMGAGAESLAAAIPETLNTGDEFFLGHYEQDNDPDNGPEPIAWQVLGSEGDMVLAVSKYALDARPFHEPREEVTWETCTLRKWLNSEFYQAAFAPEEQNLIAYMTIPNTDNPVFKTNSGNDTKDRLFVLSMAELEMFYALDDSWKSEKMICTATPYAQANGAAVNDDAQTRWWLRTMTGTGDSVLFVGSGGSIAMGFYVDDVNGAVRPAFWLDRLGSSTESEDTAGEEPEGKQDSDTGIIQTNDVGVLMRDRASYSANVLRSVLNGQEVKLLWYSKSEGIVWVRILTKEGQEGWIPASSVVPAE